MVAQLGIERPVLVTDKFMTSQARADRLSDPPDGRGCEPALFDTVPDPTTDSVDSDGLRIVAEPTRSVIGFGGGSPMDTAKALAVLARHGGVMRSITRPPTCTPVTALPIVAVPTTAGSGSEATQFTVITRQHHRREDAVPGAVVSADRDGRGFRTDDVDAGPVDRRHRRRRPHPRHRGIRQPALQRVQRRAGVGRDAHHRHLSAPRLYRRPGPYRPGSDGSCCSAGGDGVLQLQCRSRAWDEPAHRRPLPRRARAQ